MNFSPTYPWSLQHQGFPCDGHETGRKFNIFKTCPVFIFCLQLSNSKINQLFFMSVSWRLTSDEEQDHCKWVREDTKQQYLIRVGFLNYEKSSTTDSPTTTTECNKSEGKEKDGVFEQITVVL